MHSQLLERVLSEGEYRDNPPMATETDDRPFTKTNLTQGDIHPHVPLFRMTDNPIISIVTPCYNGLPYIQDALDSLQDQQYENIDHIVVDGGSTDGTLDILERSPDVRYISEPDEGIYDALNKGLDLAGGDLIGWLNADDKYAEGTFQRFAEAYRENPSCDLIAGDCSVFRESNGKEEDVERMEFSGAEAFGNGEITHSDVLLNGCLMSSSLVESLGPFDDQLVIGGDREYLIRIAASQPQLVRIHDVVYRFRMHEGSLTYSSEDGRSDGWRNATEDSIKYLPKHLSNPQLPDPLEQYCRSHFRHRAGRLLRYYLSHRDLENALRVGRRILETDPRWFLWALRQVVDRPSALREPKSIG